eukprot:TRINITY_DN8435_c0_g1_i1.p1 TRINITY_DN8435_c0_g1~~TRINITY_DN8435_c0_g1_i1.p1  ORF type:complete len:277 (-),score=45.20 TRINITY_DN8435_c0_g1_i1:8-817(-)
MRLVIRSSADEVAEFVAEHIRRRITSFAPTKERPFVLGLPTGASPLKTFARLVSFYKEGRLSFQNVITFNMDEYVGLPEEHPESYHSFMWSNLFNHVDIKRENVHILNGCAADLEAECKNYEEKIKSAGGIELFLGGIGPDGHLAFNEPGSSLGSRTRVKTLHFDTIAANAKYFGNDPAQVPKRALTVGVATVLEAREVVIIATGASKAIAIMNTVEGGVSQMWTASALQMHPNAIIACDETATLELKVKTVKYFSATEAQIAEAENHH